VATEEDALSLLFEGETNRAIAEHQLNRSSSRSHAIFSISLELRSADESSHIISSKLNLVDLAGSEVRVTRGKELRPATWSDGSVLLRYQILAYAAKKTRALYVNEAVRR
jgi:kinesin family protein 6/9